MRSGEFESGLNAAFGGKSVDDRAAGIGEAHHFGAFVESLSGSVIDGVADYLHVAVGADYYKL